MCKAILFLVFIFGAGSMASATDQTLKIRTADGIDEVTYPSDQLRRVDVLRWMQLSPNVSDSNNFIVPESLELCIDRDGRYAKCGKRNWKNPNFLKNAKVNLDHMRRRIHELDSGAYPRELKPVAEYYSKLQQISLLAEQQRLDFLTTWDVRSLKQEVAGVDPKQTCPAVLDSIAAAISKGDKEAANRIAWHDWGNCVQMTARKRLGEFPTAAWNTFLAAKGLREQFTPNSPDD
jgi:hypothetical protein